MDVRYFSNNIRKFIDSLEPLTIVKTFRTIDLLSKFGNRLGMPHSRTLKNGLFELRVRGVQDVRLIYCFHASHVVILHAFLKKTQRTLPRELGVAQERKKLIDEI